jgi:protein-S-isoprenylcysteine O-methyltransferase Ste14
MNSPTQLFPLTLPYIPSEIGGWLFGLCFFGWALFEAWVNVRQWSAHSDNQDRWSRVILIVGIVIAFGIAFIVSSLLPAFAIKQGREVLFYLGTALIPMGVLLRYIAIDQLGKFFVPEVVIQPGQRVIDTGVYRYVRHPSYTGILIALVGVGLASTNGLSLFILVVTGYSLLTYRMNIEEAALLRAFGDEYRDYMRRTKRLIPFVL